jgi:hypothetical protein
MLALDEDQETLVLATEGEKELLIINRSDLPRSVTLPMSETEGEYLDLLNNESYRYSGNQLTISISPVSGMILSR